MVLNNYYNQFLSDVSDYNESEKDVEDNKYRYGKRIPYIGWYYRHMDFMSGKLPIGNCDEFIGFMVRNKWEYPERYLTEEEFDNVMNIIDQAIEISNSGGVLTDVYNNRNKKLDELWDYMQTLKI
jgi:hypothetical protein